jgi:hypothetical protein
MQPEWNLWWVQVVWPQRVRRVRLASALRAGSDLPSECGVDRQTRLMHEEDRRLHTALRVRDRKLFHLRVGLQRRVPFDAANRWPGLRGLRLAVQLRGGDVVVHFLQEDLGCWWSFVLPGRCFRHGRRRWRGGERGRRRGRGRGRWAGWECRRWAGWERGRRAGRERRRRVARMTDWCGMAPRGGGEVAVAANGAGGLARVLTRSVTSTRQEACQGRALVVGVWTALPPATCIRPRPLQG